LILTWAALVAPLAMTPVAALAAPGDGPPTLTGPCADFAKNVHQVCGVSNPEDIGSLAGSPWLMVVEQAAPAGASGLSALNGDTYEMIRFPEESFHAAPGAKMEGEPTCVMPAKPMFGGLGARRRPGGGWRVVVIYYSDPGVAGVALLNVTLVGGKPHVALAGCVNTPKPYFLNDIASLPDGAFAATHMFDREVVAKDPEAHQQRMLNSQDTGYVVRWSKTEGWVKVPNSGGSFPNGMDASADGKTLYFNETYGHAVNAIALDGTGRRRFLVKMNPDNVTTAEDGSLILAGGIGKPLVSTKGCINFRPQGCGFPSAIDRVDPATGAITRLFVDDGSHMAGASVGVLLHDKIYIGSLWTDRITVVDLSKK
jgi:hypothetical protein